MGKFCGGLSFMTVRMIILAEFTISKLLWNAQLLLVTILLIGPPFSDDKLTDFNRNQDVT